MADLATPSAAAISTIDAKADPPSAKAPFSSKPERPDEETFKKELAKAEKELSDVQEKQKANKAKLEVAQPGKADSPAAKRRAELLEERQAIKTTQQSGKSSRGQTLDKIKRLDEQLKSLINEQKTAKSRVPFKSAEDVQQQIDRLQKQVDTGMMKLVDEKKALGEISSLNKQKKSFGALDDTQKKIDNIKAQIAEQKKTLDDPESRALSDRFNAISKELDSIKSEQDEVYKNVHSLRDERTKLHEEQQVKYKAVKELKDKYYQAKRAAADYEKEASRIRREKQRAEREAYEQGKRKQVAQAKLDEASEPAYQHEIHLAEGLIRYFDPSSAVGKANLAPSRFAAEASRTVDESGIKGTKLAKKGDEDDNYFVGSGGKKKKGGAKQARDASAASPRLQFNMAILEHLNTCGVDTPATEADIPRVIEQLKAKVQHWKDDQDRQTKENIARAQREIDKLETDAKANGTATPATNGSTDKAVNRAANDLAKARLDDDAKQS